MHLRNQSTSTGYYHKWRWLRISESDIGISYWAHLDNLHILPFGMERSTYPLPQTCESELTALVFGIIPIIGPCTPKNCILYITGKGGILMPRICILYNDPQSKYLSILFSLWNQKSNNGFPWVSAPPLLEPTLNRHTASYMSVIITEAMLYKKSKSVREAFWQRVGKMKSIIALCQYIVKWNLYFVSLMPMFWV